jgi:ketosteroid isomerase-like protein
MSTVENKQVSLKYHELSSDPAIWDEILTPDFIGRHTDERTWNRDEHKATWAKHTDAIDTIHEQIAEGDIVATRFTRKMMWKGAPLEVDIMQMKRFDGGKIAEIFEYLDLSVL